MKAVWVAVIAAGLGAAWGAGLSWANFHKSPPLEVATGAVSGQGARPRVMVDNPLYDCGVVERDVTVSHAFRFTNLGSGVLTLTPGGTSCSKCTFTKLDKTEVPPGETALVTVEYLTSYLQPNIRQTATVITNDPQQSRVELTIMGLVRSQYQLAPAMLVFSNISADETRSLSLKVYANMAKSVRIAKYELLNPETASNFEIATEPLPADEVHGGTKSACRVTATIKPGLPLGPIRQTIRLEIEFNGEPETTQVEVPITGTVSTDISIVGRGWNQETNQLNFGAIKSTEGAKRQLSLLIKGDNRHDVKVSLKQSNPEWLKVDVGEPVALKTGAVLQVPLTVEIPKGVTPGNYLGTDQGKAGEIILETTHPTVKNIRMEVRMLVEP